MRARLLGGWRDVTDDVRRLRIGLMALPETCACGHGAAHLAGSCPCCREGAHALDSTCTDCEGLLASLREKIDALVHSTLRYLPALETIVTEGESRHGGTPARLVDLRQRIFHVERIFQRLETWASEFRRDCRASHLPVMKKLAGELAVAAGEVDEMLEPTPARPGP